MFQLEEWRWILHSDPANVSHFHTTFSIVFSLSNPTIVLLPLLLVLNP